MSNTLSFGVNFLVADLDSSFLEVNSDLGSLHCCIVCRWDAVGNVLRGVTGGVASKKSANESKDSAILDQKRARWIFQICSRLGAIYGGHRRGRRPLGSEVKDRRTNKRCIAKRCSKYKVATDTEEFRGNSKPELWEYFGSTNWLIQ